MGADNLPAAAPAPEMFLVFPPENSEVVSYFVTHHGLAVNELHFTKGNSLDALRVKLMLIREKSCRERLIRVRRKHRYNRLTNDCAAVKHRRNKVHCRAVYPAAGVNGTLMRVKSRKERQKCRMNIEDFAFPAGDKRLREDMKPANTMTAGL